MKKMYNSWQLKQISDTMEAKCAKKLAAYDAASSDAKEAHRALFSLLRDDDQRELVLSHQSYKNTIDTKTKWLLQMRIRENELKDVYIAAEEEAVSARHNQHEKELADRDWFIDEH
jgi:hypothetical protein